MIDAFTLIGTSARVGRGTDLNFFLRYEERRDFLKQACEVGHGAFDGSVDISGSDIKIVGFEGILAKQLIPVSLFHKLPEDKMHAFALFCELSFAMFKLNVFVADPGGVEGVPGTMPEDFLHEYELWLALFGLE